MKLLKSFIVVLTGMTFALNVAGQADPYVNILTQNGGSVVQGADLFIEVTVGNAGPVDEVPMGKVIAQVSVPSGLVSIAASGHVLPSGWTILSNSGTSIQICNSSGAIALFDEQTIFINVHGDNTGGPQTIIGQLSAGTGCVPGGSIAGDDNSNNSSTSTIEVTGTLPVTLSSFDALLMNCKPILHWATETEINSDRFEIERSITANSDWTLIGSVPSNGNSTAKNDYSFTDPDVNGSEKFFYRLRMVDRDGKYKYSEALRVFVNCRSIRIDVYPNPVQKGKLYIGITGATGNPEAMLLSLSGQVLAKKTVSNGTNYLTVSSIANGVYILSVKDSNGIDKKIKVIIGN